MTRSCRWTPLGPIGLVTSSSEPGKRIASGRVTAIAVHPTDPNIVYVGTAGGGVWRTPDRGHTWKPLLDRGECLAIGAIAVDPSNPNRVFVGTGEGNDTQMAFLGVGLLISEDAGQTWNRIPLGAERTTCIVVSPTGNRVFLASTTGTWEHRREDDPGGTYAVGTWKSLNQAWTSDLVYDDLADRLYMAVRGDGVYVRQANTSPAPLGLGGNSNQNLPSAATVGSLSRIAIAWTPAERKVLFAVYTHRAASNTRVYGIYRSDDSGGTWAPVVAPRADPETDLNGIFAEKQAGYNLVFARNPSRTTDLFLGINEIQRSQNLGASLEPGSNQSSASDNSSDDSDTEEEMTGDVHPDQHAIAFASSGDIWLGNDGGVWLSTDGGTNWSHRNRGLGVMQFYAGTHDADFAGLAYAGSQDNGSQFYNGHSVWQRSAGGDAGDVAIDSANRRAWVATNNAAIEVSERLDERSESFTVLKSEDDSEQFFTRIALAPSNPNAAYLANGGSGFLGRIGRLYRTDVDLEPWLFDVREYDDVGQAVVALTVAPDDARLVYVADIANRVYQVEYGSLNSAVTALPVLPSSTTSAWIRDMAVSPRDRHRVYVAIGEAAGNLTRAPISRLFRWDGGANTWTDLTSGLVAVTAGSITIDPRENGIHAIVVDPNPSITDPALERVYIGCDRGVFESNDGGQSWRGIHDGLPLTPVFDLAFHAAERTIRAFTHGRGAWERAADVEPCTAPPSSPEIDLYVRDVRYDGGKLPSDVQALDPVRRDGRARSKKERRVTLRFTDAPDLKVDRQSIAGENEADDEPQFQVGASTVDYTTNGAVDSIGMEYLAHRSPRKNAKARVYLQVHNRGPDAATGVTVRAFFADAGSNGSWPDLPSDFWTSFPATDPAPGSAWKPIGVAKTISEIRPGEPEVVSWDWDVPAGVADVIGILAVVTSADDNVFLGTTPGAMSRTVEPLVRTNKHICLKRTGTTRAAEASAWHKVGNVLKWVGIGLLVGAAATAVGYGIYEGYEEIEH